jgi:hypothetical protein
MIFISNPLEAIPVHSIITIRLWVKFLGYLSIYLSIYLPVCLSVYLSIHPSIRPSIHGSSASYQALVAFQFLMF